MNQNISKIKSEFQKYSFIKQIKQLPFVNQVLLFGSRARGTNQSRSDIDLAIICPKATEQDWFKILDIVDQADTLLAIDCVRFDTIVDEEFKNRILKDGVEL